MRISDWSSDVGSSDLPTVDENGVLGVMPGCDIVERIIVDPATANDADRKVEGLHAKPGQRIFEQDPDGRACAGKREDHTAPRRLRTALDSTGKLFDVMAQTQIGRAHV